MKIGLSTLTSKCLCETHNSALSPLDAAAAQFFAAIESADLNRSAPAISVLVSGHDIERWMLKTLFAFALSKSLARDGQPLLPKFHSSIDVVEMLVNPNAWPIGSGLYFLQELGASVPRHDEFGLAPLTIPVSDEFAGMRTSVQGLEFDLLAVPAGNSKIVRPQGLYRPGRLKFRHGEVVNEILISWADGEPHGDVELTFRSTFGETQSKGHSLPTTFFRR